LGNTLLERNKDLEETIKHQQGVIEDQVQEIEFLTKQTTALKEVNESRVRIYEQIEVSLSELEQNNLKLSEDSAAEKSRIRSLSSTVTALESKCEELQRSLEEAERAIKQRKQKRNSVFLEKNPSSESLCLNCSKPNEKSSRKNSQILFCNDPDVSPETLGIAALFVESLKCENQINVKQCRNYQDAACDARTEEVDTDRADVSRLEEEALRDRLKIQELEEQIETLLSEKDDLLCSLREEQLKISLQKIETEKNNNLSHPHSYTVSPPSPALRAELCALCSPYEEDHREHLHDLMLGVWSFILSVMCPTPHLSWLDTFLLSTSLATLLLGILATVVSTLFT